MSEAIDATVNTQAGFLRILSSSRSLSFSVR
jgi:hypothetical protein